MKKNIPYLLLIFILGMAGGIFANQIFWPYFINKPLFEKYNLEQPPIYVTERKEITIQENTALTEAIEKVSKTVIGVKTKTMQGSGLIVTNDGLVVTLARLVPNSEIFSFYIDGVLQNFQILKRDAKTGLALVKLEANKLLSPNFRDFEDLKLGERVFMVSYRDGLTKSVNEGIIKFIGKARIETNIIEKDSVQGSPLFDIQGRLIGIAVGSLAGQGNQIEAIPVSEVKNLLK
ncbi:MAG: hypothetical protein COX42_01480 [Parcubacteria group bacterium CG23_combo_of_CG06-09_8_20_14_all_35_6]|nr:MAG: hypothetical protein COX42_01480 [Parcubacteria group bacterium CG23_combo_of_CG06-09_8_20_14_all_35_6]